MFMRKNKKILLISVAMLACLFILSGCTKVNLTGVNATNTPGAANQGGTPPEGMTPPDGGTPPLDGETPPVEAGPNN